MERWAREKTGGELEEEEGGGRGGGGGGGREGSSLRRSLARLQAALR